MRRRLTHEHMDDPAASRDDLAASLRYLRLINARLGGRRALLRHLNRWSHRWPRNRPITLLDIATGAADLPLAARAWAERRGFDLRITAIDLHPTTLSLAREHVGAAAGIEIVQADALKLTDRYEPASFDYVHAGLFLHHLPDIQALTMLRIMDRLARAGIIWNDLVRSRLGLIAIHGLTIGQPDIIRHDARVSVAAGFTPAEARDYARRLDLRYCSVRWNLLTHRFTLAGEKPGAW